MAELIYFKNSFALKSEVFGVNSCFLYFSFKASFVGSEVEFVFKNLGLPEVQPGQIRINRKGNKMEVIL